MEWLYAILAVLAVSLVSFIGATVFLVPRIHSHAFLLVLVALAAGTLVGDAVLHLLPEANEHWGGDGAAVGSLVLAGFVAFFLLELVLRGRHAHLESIHPDIHPHEHSHGATPHAPLKPFAITNLVGDAMHNFLDGVAIGAAFLVDIAAGIATTVAVFLHEIPQELADFGVLVRGGMAPRKALLFNAMTALTAILGTVTILAIPLDPETLSMVVVPIIAGAFLYIGSADLVPELHHHSRGPDAWRIAVAFLVGLGIMFGILGLESAGIGAEAGHGHD